MKIYQPFLTSPTAGQWKKIGVRKRSGVATPLFSVYSKKSVGVGEVPDLKLLIDWCSASGLSIIQLLPLNDVGFNFRPYDAQSSFALEPMHLSLEKLSFVDLTPFRSEIRQLRKKLAIKECHFNKGVKRAKLDLLWRIFREKRTAAGGKPFKKYLEKNRFWIDSYALFKVIKEKTGERGWQDWPEEWRRGEPRALEILKSKEAGRIEFHQWLQWQLYRQLCEVKKYAVRKKVLLMGDLPFLVSRDSADVWSDPGNFKLDFAAGAPPDLYFAEGQEWGMPPYDWGRIAARGYEGLIEKLRYAEHFYDLFRVDHFVGIFRLWTIPLSGPPETRMGQGFFDPPDETKWEGHGKKILSVIVRSSRMLPCAEDLGTIPKCSYKVLEEFAVPGTEIQRWSRAWETTGDFIAPEDYRKNSIAVISTHDMAPFVLWWTREATDDEKNRFSRCIGLENMDHRKKLSGIVRQAIEAASRSASIFAIQLLQDWLSMDEAFACEGAAPHAPAEFRINVPGVVNDKNWTLTMPFSLEKMIASPLTRRIRALNAVTGRDRFNSS